MYKHKRRTRERTISTEEWERFYKVIFANPRGGSPGVAFHLETMENVDGKVASTDARQIAFTLPQTTFPILNNQGEVVGSMETTELFQAIKSLYYHLDPEV